MANLLSVVVPVYHNAPSLPALLSRLQAVAASIPDPVELVFVDDGSKDDSYQVLSELVRAEPRMRVVKLSRNFGSFVAIVAGLTHARGAAAAVISADLQDPPEMIPQMLEKWREGHEVVLATRSSRDDPWLDRALAGIFYRLMRWIALPDMPVGGFDFMLIDRKVIDVLVQTREKNTSMIGLVLWSGFRRAILSYDRRKREHGRSMWTMGKKVNYFIDSIVAFSFLPVRLATMAGLLAGTIAFVYAGVVVMAYFFWNIPVRGWPSMMIALLGMGGVQLTTLGILGEYLWRSLDETRRRPLFIVQETLGTSGDVASRANEPS